eukprot:COSAG05_NODE_63_length_22889_cov_41.986617_2_plen_1561_part_00
MLHIVQQYAASKALRKSKSTDPAVIAKLNRAAERESDHNQSETELRKGIPARFGALYQILVPVLDQYLEMQKSIAEEDQSAMQLSVASPDKRSKMPWFKVKPAFATRSEGEKIQMGDTVILESLKMSGMYLHCNSTEHASLGHTRELNVGSVPTRFQIVPVAKHSIHKLESRTTPRGAHYFQIYQRDPQAYLFRDGDGIPKLRRISPLGNVARETASHKADLTFTLESPTMEWSGVPLQQMRHGDQQQFALRDAMSSCFLTESSSDGGLEFGEHGHVLEARWNFVPVDSATELFKCDETSFWIKNCATGRILSRVPAERSSKHHPTAMHGVTTVSDFEINEADAFVLRPVPRTWLRSFQKMENDMAQLGRFRTDLLTQASESGSLEQRAKKICQMHLLPQLKAGSSPEGRVFSVLQNLLLSISKSKDMNPLTRNGVMNTRMQSMLAEFRTIELVFDTLDAMFAFIPRDEIVKGESCDFGPEFLRVALYMYRLLGMMARGNENTSRDIKDLHGQSGKGLDKLAQQLGYPFKVAHVIQELFQSSSVAIREFPDGFMQKLWTHTITLKHSRFPDLLGVLLSHRGSAVKFNQDTLIEIIIKTFPKGVFNAKAIEGYTRGKKESADVVEAREFCESMVKLASLLCNGRHRASTDFFLQGSVGKKPIFNFAYSNLKDIIRDKDRKYKSSTRLVYSMLMTSLYIDREPYFPRQPVMKARILPSVQIDKLNLGAPSRVDPYANLKGVERPDHCFQSLKDAILETLQGVDRVDARNAQFNRFLVALLDLAMQLLTFGCYDNQFDADKHDGGILLLGDESKQLGAAMLNLLKGDTETHESNGASFVVGYETQSLLDVKFKVLAMIDLLFSLRASSKLDLVLRSFYAGSGSTDTNPKASKKKRPKNVPKPASNVEKLQKSPARGVSVTAGTKYDNPLQIANPMSELEIVVGSDDDDDDDADTDGQESVPGHYVDKDLLASVVMELKSIRAFSKDFERTLSDNLNNLMRYDGHGEIGFAAFNSLIYFLSQQFIFSNVLKNVLTIEKPEQAKQFLEAGALVNEYRRLRKWLHEDEQALECVRVCVQLQAVCKTSMGQTMLHHLGAAEYMLSVLRMRLKGSAFESLLNSTLILVSEFCSKNKQNQELMVPHIDLVLMLLPDPVYTDSAAHCIAGLIRDNMTLVTELCDRLLSAAVGLSKQSRNCTLLDLLDSMIVVEGHPVPAVQSKVCQAAIKSENLLQISLENRVKAYSSNSDIIYHQRSIALLAVCSQGHNPTTELLCASIIPYDEICARLHELYCHPSLVGRRTEITDILRATASYFREVFVDTNSEHIQMSVRSVGSGVWSVNRMVHPKWARPVAVCMLEDLRALATENVSMNHKEYIVEEAACFFLSFATKIKPSSVHPDELTIAVNTMHEAAKLAKTILKEEKYEGVHQYNVLTELSTVGQDFTIGKHKGIEQISRMRMLLGGATNLQARAAASKQRLKVERESNDRVAGPPWRFVVKSLLGQMQVGEVKGTARTAGKGIIRVAKCLWRVSKIIGLVYAAPAGSDSLDIYTRKLTICALDADNSYGR